MRFLEIVSWTIMGSIIRCLFKGNFYKEHITSNIYTLSSRYLLLDMLSFLFASNSNIFKGKIISNIRMFPGDPMGSPDDFFLRNYLRLRRFL